MLLYLSHAREILYFYWFIVSFYFLKTCLCLHAFQFYVGSCLNVFNFICVALLLSVCFRHRLSCMAAPSHPSFFLPPFNALLFSLDSLCVFPSFPPFYPVSLPNKLITEVVFACCCCCQVSFMGCVCMCVTEMKQSHMPLSSGGSVMENCYLLSHTHPVSACLRGIQHLCVCVCVSGLGKSLLSPFYTLCD